jgi:prepilin-type N-terminal cleavage/methylation domain-containing protein
MKSVTRGFTLIELLIVIAVLGILAAGVLVALNPFEQLARGRDAGRRSAIDQVGKATQVYYTAQTTYPTQGTTWMTLLQTSGEIKVLPTNPSASGYTTGCNTAGVAEGGYCYQTNGTDAVVYGRAESKSNWTSAGCTGTQVAWIVWSSADGKTGVACLAANADPAVGITGLK